MGIPAPRPASCTVSQQQAAATEIAAAEAAGAVAGVGGRDHRLRGAEPESAGEWLGMHQALAQLPTIVPANTVVINPLCWAPTCLACMQDLAAEVRERLEGTSLYLVGMMGRCAPPFARHVSIPVLIPGPRVVMLVCLYQACAVEVCMLALALHSTRK